MQDRDETKKTLQLWKQTLSFVRVPRVLSAKNNRANRTFFTTSSQIALKAIENIMMLQQQQQQQQQQATNSSCIALPRRCTSVPQRLDAWFSSSNHHSPDDYGECDMSLQSYRRSEDSSYSGQRSSGLFCLSLEEANELLGAVLEDTQLLSSSEKMQVSFVKLNPETGRGLYSVVVKDINIDLSIRNDLQHFDIWTVVLSHCPRPSYKILTKMSKYNAQLLTSTHKVVYQNGTLLLRTTAKLLQLTRQSRLRMMLQEFALLANEIVQDLKGTNSTSY
jgi:hypothetical protein